MPILSDLVEIQFRKGKNMLYYKKSFRNKEYVELDFLRPSIVKAGNEKCFQLHGCKDGELRRGKRIQLLVFLKMYQTRKKDFGKICRQMNYL